VSSKYLRRIDYNSKLMHVATRSRRVILVATTNRGKLRDFEAAAARHGIEIAALPNFTQIPPAREDAPTFEANACKKAEHYSRHVKDRIVLADDSGLRVDALGGAPGVRSARYAADFSDNKTASNSSDRENNERLLRELKDTPDNLRSARFICALAAAINGRTLVVCRGEVSGTILHEPAGSGGFGYDPLFYVGALKKTFAELSPEEKNSISHRGQAFQKFLRWYVKHEQELK
jgi:XTP/dITP diphosphohydrolase